MHSVQNSGIFLDPTLYVSSMEEVLVGPGLQSQSAGNTKRKGKSSGLYPPWCVSCWKGQHSFAWKISGLKCSALDGSCSGAPTTQLHSFYK